jgi:hypothetical protein
MTLHDGLPFSQSLLTHPRPSRSTSRLTKHMSVNRKILTTSLSSPLLHTVEAGLVDRCKLFSDASSLPLRLLDASELLVKGTAA